MTALSSYLPDNAVIKVIGVGGGGGNALQHMLDVNIENVEFICANTDAQAINSIGVNRIIQLGDQITQGLGAGADPEVGRQSALEARLHITEMLFGADMVFITAGMGGGTGTGAAPIIAEVAQELGILTVAVVTKPFPFEGQKRMRIALEGIKELRNHTDSLIIVPNEKLLPVLGKDCSLINAFDTANDVLSSAVKGVSDLITCPGMINVDFADVKSVMSTRGVAMMGTGITQGEDRAKKAAQAALKSPLLEDVDLSGASGILVNVAASESLSLGEFNEVGETIGKYSSEHTTVVIGTVIEPNLEESLRVTVVVTGLKSNDEKVAEQKKVTELPRLASKRDIAELENSPKLTHSDFDRGLDREFDNSLNCCFDRELNHDSNSEDEQKFNNILALDKIDIPALLRR